MILFKVKNLSYRQKKIMLYSERIKVGLFKKNTKLTPLFFNNFFNRAKTSIRAEHYTLNSALRKKNKKWQFQK
jgi:hypothetical protein